MSSTAQELAAQFEAANDEAIALVEGLSDADWRKTTEEGWTVAATAHHAAIVHEGIANFVQEVAEGTAAPRPGMESIDQSNAEHARAFADCSTAEVLAAFRTKGAAATAIVRGLSDEELARTSDAIPGMPPQSARWIIEMALMRHLAAHVASIKAALSA
jgi:uncharacterized damage-inducible protein DinB